MLLKTNEREILEEYKSSNMAKRLNHYVQYRELRHEFFEIDASEGKRQKTLDVIRLHSNQAPDNKRHRSRWLRCLAHGFACK